MEDKIKKLLMKALRNKDASKALLDEELAIQFRTTIGVSLNDHIDAYQNAVNELVESEFIRFEQIRNGTRFIRGINFDDYFLAATSARVVNYNVGTVSGGNVQFGNGNSIVIGQGLHELIKQIDESSAPEEEKEDAKSRIYALIQSPTAAAILGGVASGIVGALG